MTDEQQKGTVFNIQKFSVHDGDGIRTLVFLKGCPLRCGWCSNPESQRTQPEHAFNPSRCLTAEVCGRCIEACETGALSLREGLILFDVRRCRQCMRCVEACPSGAQTRYGDVMTVKEVLDKVERDGVFFSRSGGGLTLSGGEALTQFDFAMALLRTARSHALDTTIETCGYYPYEKLREACTCLDGLIYDIKIFDSEKHKKYTGVGNEPILGNFKRVVEDFPDLPILVRTPVIPGVNDTDEEIRAIRDFIPRRPNIEYELLTYHRLGQPKYGYLGRPYGLDTEIVADKERMRHLRSLVSDSSAAAASLP